MNAFLNGIGTLVGKLAERFIPRRQESIANEIESLERKINDLQAQNYTPVSANLYLKYTRRLSELRKKAKNN